MKDAFTRKHDANIIRQVRRLLLKEKAPDKCTCSSCEMELVNSEEQRFSAYVFLGCIAAAAILLTLIATGWVKI